jgi:7,8-dihydroneopterin aldolase/epimerase/oxygenase
LTEPDSCIELRGLRVLGHHGVSEAERQNAQPFEIDLDVHLDAVEASATDDVTKTVDYGVLAEQVQAVVTDGSFKLLETLADAIAGVVLSYERVSSVTVVVRKLRPPVGVDLDTAGVRTTRHRVPG